MRRRPPGARLLMAEPILKVALDAPVMQCFDYLPPPSSLPLRAGQRVAVPFRSGDVMPSSTRQ